MADTHMPAQKDLTLERIFQAPSLSGPSPQGVKFSPDGKRVTFLKLGEEDGRYDLWQFDVASGEQSMLVDSKLLEAEETELSEEEKALRERKRIAGRKGIVSYDWGTVDTILVPLGGDLHLVKLGASDEIQVTMLPKAEEAGITLAEVSEAIRQTYFSEEVQHLPRADDNERVMARSSKTGTPDPADMLNIVIRVVDDQAIRLSDVAELSPTDGEPIVRQLTNTDAFEYDAKVSPGGKYVSFIRDGAVWAIDLSTNKEARLTPEAEPENTIQYGVAEFVAQEEMSRYTGYWWSSDDRYLAYTRVDESTVDIIPRFDIAADEVTIIEQRYPRAGRPNAIVDLFVRDMETGEVTEVNWRRDDWGPATDQYLARVNWVHGGLFVQAVNRDQELLAGRLASGPEFKFAIFQEDGQRFYEPQPNWINLSNDLLALSVDDHTPFLTTSERTGFRQIYGGWRSGPVDLSEITTGDWPVDALEGVDKESGLVFFTAYKDTPLERQLYVASYRESSTSAPTRLTELGKTWSITMAPDGQSFVGTSSSPTQPPQTGLYKSDGTLITWIEENALDETHPYAPYLQDHTVPEYGTLKAEDGQDLYYSIQTPPDFDETKQYPVIVNVYGGPHAQTVTRDWERMSDQYYTRQGYIVWRLDNRGSANRGKKFEDVIYRQMGIPEVRDQLVGVEHLKSLPYVDAENIAIQGWSYGGYMTLMTILQSPEGTFAAAVAGAPVTDWSLYDTFYTERYMDTPQDNPEGYEKSSVFYHLDQLKHDLPPLMLVHGMADDNVTFDNTTRLMAELQKRHILFDLMTYPGQRHGIRDNDMSIHLMKTRMRFLNQHLKGKT